MERIQHQLTNFPNKFLQCSPPTNSIHFFYLHFQIWTWIPIIKDECGFRQQGKKIEIRLYVPAAGHVMRKKIFVFFHNIPKWKIWYFFTSSFTSKSLEPEKNANPVKSSQSAVMNDKPDNNYRHPLFMMMLVRPLTLMVKVTTLTSNRNIHKEKNNPPRDPRE